ncbi:PHP domain-containing protein [Kibdelosporangium persicum]|uniref:DNA-dependent DNA polymerase beta chain n=1 Tax=Kibdelosporangium persicum TaxID=2698649 RepID=A0ABX2FCM0_9PSEU|nr:PHP domain-containing protein [Kibdelosporangium persicum]NRN68505.1 DNA-dependent DNA polymerase beta chain [Kibdelosporangium persicum]
MDPAKALRLIGFYLERRGEATFKVQAFRKAAAIVDGLPAEEVQVRAKRGTLTQLPGIGKATAGVISDAVTGREPEYLSKLIEEAKLPVAGGHAMRAALKGDCHTHSEWSDGGSTIREMAEAARDLGHEWMALTDHSPRLTVANGLSAERLRRQLDVVAELNEELKPFRILTGIEVDILLDGSLDQDEELLAQLDIVVASVHSKLRMPSFEMTRRMIKAVSNPHVTILGHCTGRMRTAKRDRPESTFDAKAVFEACRDNGVAVEINSRPERLDPPLRLLRLAVEIGCDFAIDSDAHAPGQLDWLPHGCERAEACDVPVDRVINARSNPVG